MMMQKIIDAWGILWQNGAMQVRLDKTSKAIIRKYKRLFYPKTKISSAQIANLLIGIAYGSGDFK